jgi:hypothetical protein
MWRKKARPGRQLGKSVVRETKHDNGGKKLWDYSIQYWVQLAVKVMLLAERLRL